MVSLADDWQSTGQGFESPQLHQKFPQLSPFCRHHTIAANSLYSLLAFSAALWNLAAAAFCNPGTTWL